MRNYLLALLTLVFSTAALAQSASCNAAATEKKLVGAAKTAFLKKCEMDVKANMTTVATNDNKKMSLAHPMGKKSYGGCSYDAAADL